MSNINEKIKQIRESNAMLAEKHRLLDEEFDKLMDEYKHTDKEKIEEGSMSIPKWPLISNLFTMIVGAVLLTFGYSVLGFIGYAIVSLATVVFFNWKIKKMMV